MAKTWFQAVLRKITPSIASGLACRPSGTPGLEAPNRNEIADVLSIDLAQRTEAPVAVIAPVHQPVVVVAVGAKKAFAADENLRGLGFRRRLYRAFRQAPQIGDD